MSDGASGKTAGAQWRLSSRADFFFGLRECLGKVHGSEETCLLLYSMVKREKPAVVVELGTGMGVTTAWIAAAMRENGGGTIFTYDNGAHYQRPAVREFLAGMNGSLLPLAKASSQAEYPDFLQLLFDQAGVADHVAFRQTDIGRPQVLADIAGKSIDLLFSDFDHSALTVQRIVGAFLPYMAPTSSIFIDSASTHLPAYYALNQMVGFLRDMRLPKNMAELLSEKELCSALDLIARSTFKLQHLVEKEDRPQNSTAWIRIEPVDMLPPVSSFLH